MQVKETLNEGLKRGYEITMTAAQLEAKVDEKIEAARADIEIKGFRKGKAPKALLKKKFGQSVLGEAMQEGIDDALRGHFESTGDRPAIQPDVKMTNDEWKEGDDVVVSVAYECLPAIPEADFASISLERLVVEPGEDEITEALANLAETAKNFEDRAEGEAAEDGDQITFDFLGKVDGEAFEGGAAEDYPLVLGSNSFIPGFEEQLIGSKAGEEKDVNVTFPEAYQAEHLAGKDAVFECKIKAVAKPVASEIDDELAKKFGAEDLEGLKAQVKERLESEFKGAGRSVLKRQLLDALDAAVKFDLPPSLVKAEADQIAHQVWHEENPEVQGHDHPEIEPTEEHNTIAERRVRLGLLLAEIGQKAEVTVSEQEMNMAIFQQAQQYPGQEKAFFDFIRSNEQAMQQLRAPLFEDKVVDYVLEQAAVTEKSVTKEDLQAAIEALEAEE